MPVTEAEFVAKNRVWNSLEICKLAANFATPLLVFFLGCAIWRGQQEIVQHWQRDQFAEQSRVEASSKEQDQIRALRLSIYRQASPLLNDILAYLFRVGRWKEWSPVQIIEEKRQLDSLMYSNIALFSPEFFKLYHDFMRQSFRAAGNPHDESRIRTKAQCRRQAPDGYFTGEDTRRDLCLAYVDLLQRWSEELLLQSLKMPSQTDAEKFAICPPIYNLEGC